MNFVTSTLTTVVTPAGTYDDNDEITEGEVGSSEAVSASFANACADSKRICMSWRVERIGIHEDGRMELGISHFWGWKTPSNSTAGASDLDPPNLYMSSGKWMKMDP